MKNAFVVLAIVVLLIGLAGLVGCGHSTEFEGSKKKVKNDLEGYSITIVVDRSCPEGWERVNQTVFGVHRIGCYPIDFDYEAANDRLAEHLNKEAPK